MSMNGSCRHAARRATACFSRNAATHDGGHRQTSNSSGFGDPSTGVVLTVNECTYCT